MIRFLTPLIVSLVFILDRLTKIVVQKSIALGESVKLLPFFSMTYVENTGAAFSLGQNRNKLLTAVSILILGLIFYLRRQWEKTYPLNYRLKIGVSLVIGGALGNLYDRIRYGSVIDFLDFYIETRHWPAFNLADSAICVGAFLLAFSHWKHDSHPL